MPGRNRKWSHHQTQLSPWRERVPGTSPQTAVFNPGNGSRQYPPVPLSCGVWERLHPITPTCGSLIPGISCISAGRRKQTVCRSAKAENTTVRSGMRIPWNFFFHRTAERSYTSSEIPKMQSMMNCRKTAEKIIAWTGTGNGTTKPDTRTIYGPENLKSTWHPTACRKSSRAMNGASMQSATVSVHRRKAPGTFLPKEISAPWNGSAS